jgi:hypothetical protein
MIGGVPCSGKTTLMMKLLDEVGDTDIVEPMKSFKCMEYSKGLIIGKYPKDDGLISGNYPKSEWYGGTDRLAYSTINKFQKFISSQYLHHKNIIAEGDRFFIEKHLDWLCRTYKKNVKIYVLEATEKELVRRHIERKDKQSQKWILGRQTLISNLIENPNLSERIVVKKVNTKNALTRLKNEIFQIIKGDYDD